jgi:diaminopimelate epimerase
VATALVGHLRSSVTMSTGRRFWKMTGSGNDFVFFDAMEVPPGTLASVRAIGALCDRRSGVGADGVVFLEPRAGFDFAMSYYNRDGSLAEMCGNAALCSARLARELGLVPEGRPFAFQTPSGPVTGRFSDGLPEIEMVPVTELASRFDTGLMAGERQVGYARVGVPHLVVLCDDVDVVDVPGRGRELRWLPTLPAGANANFVSQSRADDPWLIRTFERGVEEETLACVTGAVATVALLAAWGLVRDSATLRTRSGRPLTVLLPASGRRDAPILRGEGRIVFEGTLADLPL